MVLPSENTEVFRILLMDDEASFCQAIKDILRMSSLDVYTFQDPSQGIEQAQHIQPHLILLDFYFPNTTGLEILTQLKHSTNLQHIPVIMLTSSSQKEHIESSQALGAADYLVKPFRIPYFQQKLNQHLPAPVFVDLPSSTAPHLNLFEPDPNLRNLLFTLLTNQGYRVQLSESLEAACKLSIHPPIALFNPEQDPEHAYSQYCQAHHIPQIHYALDLNDFPWQEQILQHLLKQIKQSIQGTQPPCQS